MWHTRSTYAQDIQTGRYDEDLFCRCKSAVDFDMFELIMYSTTTVVLAFCQVTCR